VIESGRVIAEGTPDRLKSTLGGDRIDVVVRSHDDCASAAATVRQVTGSHADVDPDRRRISAPVRDRATALIQVVRALDDAGIAAEDIALRRPTLDEVFLHLTGHRTEQTDQEVSV
jgi:ABC-2 type transport system ATP-binding protein